MLERADTDIENKLILAAIDGNFEAFEELITPYTRPLWSFVFRMLDNSEDANDVLQQILWQAYRSLPILQNPDRFRPWLFTIARRKCIDCLRREKTLPFAEFAKINSESEEDEANQELQLLQNIPDPAPLPDEIIERQETIQLLQDAIATLPERTRQVVALRYATDLSFSEIAQTLNLNENTVKTLFQRAKTQLRFYIRQRS